MHRCGGLLILAWSNIFSIAKPSPWVRAATFSQPILHFAAVNQLFGPQKASLAIRKIVSKLAFFKSVLTLVKSGFIWAEKASLAIRKIVSNVHFFEHARLLLNLGLFGRLQTDLPPLRLFVDFILQR
jgi:hypothetical protein